jgi:hypothetical protein
MAKVRLSRNVYNNDDLSKTVSRDFTSFVEETSDENDTVNELFRLYSKLFYDIPAQGDIESHEFLIRESSKVVELEQENLEVQPLLDEIADLRERLLQQNIASIEAQTELAASVNSSGTGFKDNAKVLEQLNQKVEQVREQRIESPTPVKTVQARVVDERQYKPFGKPGLRPNEIKKYDGKDYLWRPRSQSWERKYY